MKARRLSGLLALALAAAGLTAGCAVNPVTGQTQLQLLGSDWEREVGARMYMPMKQSQGGDFVLDPRLTAYLEEVGDRVAARARRRDELDFEFSILNDSVPNAWALPGGKIVINRGLLTELSSEAELAAVLSHEIVHADAAHGAHAQSKGMLTQAGAVISMVILGSAIPSQSAREVAMMVPALGAQLLTQKYGRDAEREADEYGMLYLSEAGYDPQGAVQLQETFLQLAEGRDPDWISGLFASHPPSRERVQNNRRTAARLPQAGVVAAERYREMIHYLREVEPAYAAYDEAQKALAEDQPQRAQEKLDAALEIEPRESLFLALQGDLYALDGDRERALGAYEEAVAANPGYFYGHLRTGQMNYRTDRPGRARAGLQASLELMPTAEAHYLLGILDRREGQIDSAMQHFRAAAQSDSETGLLAARELLILDLPENPSRYVALRLALDPENQVWVQLGNATPFALSNIEVRFAWLDDQGTPREGRRSFAGPLPAGQQAQLSLGVRLSRPAELAQRVQAGVTAARLADEGAQASPASD